MTDATRATEIVEIVTTLDVHGPRGGSNTPAPTSDVAVGLGRYAFRSLLGTGGMGEVRLCHDPQIGRDVAVKVMHESAARNSESVRRFLREVRVQGQLEHPAIVPVYDLGTSDSGEHYFAMKRVRGTTLHEIMLALEANEPEAKLRFSRRRLLAAFASVCLALDFAHSRGVLHRDIKPSNIMLGEFGEVYVLDWGIARVRGEPEPTAVEDAVDPGDSTQPPRAWSQGRRATWRLSRCAASRSTHARTSMRSEQSCSRS